MRLRRGGGLRVNPLDPGPGAAHLPEADQLAHRANLAATLLAIVLGQAELPAGQQRLVAAAVRHIIAPWEWAFAGTDAAMRGTWADTDPLLSLRGIP